MVAGATRPARKLAPTELRCAQVMRLLLGAIGALAVSGCATLTEDAGFSPVRAITKERTGYEARWARTKGDADAIETTVREILARPLSVDDAVRIALINNRGLQAAYAEVGIAETELFQATWPLNGLERDRLTATQLSVAAQALDVAAQATRAYFRTIAAEQTAKYMEQVQVAAEAGAELGRRMAQAGNWSKLDQARERSFYVDAIARVARARQAAVSEREKLVRVLGLGDADAPIQLPERLPDLPARISDATALEARALADRLDVQAAKKEVEGLAASLGLTKTTRFINVLEGGYKTQSDTGLPLRTGYEVSVELPLFDWSGAKHARAEYIYMQGVDRAAAVASNARSEVRETYAAYRTAFDLARHYRDEVVPLRKQISDENLLRYNGMLVSVFELLADARDQVSAVNASIEALRDFWLAETDLKMAMTGSSSALNCAASRPRID